MKDYDAFKRLWDRVNKLEDRLNLIESGNINYGTRRFETEQDIDDPLFPEVKDFVIGIGQASAGILQRRFRIGYARSARLLDLLEEFGVIGPADGAKPRDVLI